MAKICSKCCKFGNAGCVPVHTEDSKIHMRHEEKIKGTHRDGEKHKVNIRVNCILHAFGVMNRGGPLRDEGVMSRRVSLPLVLYLRNVFFFSLFTTACTGMPNGYVYYL